MGALRQAIVFIHGMGEQRPLETVRAGAFAAIPPRSDELPRFFSHPDDITHGYDARVYVAHWNTPVRTYVFEYHWAHLMTGNKVSHLSRLVRRVMWRVPVLQLPLRLVPFWVLLWSLVSVAAWLVIDGGFDAVNTAVAYPLVGVAVGLLTLFITSSFVDVARYWDGSPKNQKVRDDIRRGALELLQGLHDSNRYQRIIIVGHSLGTFIAYDAISLLWSQMNKLHANLDEPAERALKELEMVGTRLRESKATVEEYQVAQRTAWIEHRMNGSPWLITDFVALGSPLAYAHVFFSKNREEFRKRQERREAPSAPPVRDPFPGNLQAERGWHDGDTYSYSTQPGGVRVLHHAAPFVLVRWSSLTFPADLFAGTLEPNFGPGVRDIWLTGDRLLTKVPVAAHTRYFKYHDSPRPGGSVATLRDVLDLDSDLWLHETLTAPGHVATD